MFICCSFCPLIWFLSLPACKHGKSLFLTCRALADALQAGSAPGAPAAKRRVQLCRCFPSCAEKDICSWKPTSSNQITSGQLINYGSFPKAGHRYRILEPLHYICSLITLYVGDRGNLCEQALSVTTGFYLKATNAQSSGMNRQRGARAITAINMQQVPGK